MLRRTVCIIVATAAVVGLVSMARGLFHVAVIDEVMTSYDGDPSAQFIEVRMLASLQNFVHHTILAAFDSSGAYIGDILEVPGDVANSGDGVRWLVATAEFQGMTGLPADFTMPAGILPTGGGMVCFGGGGGITAADPPSWDRTDFANYVDCVAYGTYAGTANSKTGTPTTLDGDGHSLQRVGNSMDNLADFTCGDPASPENNAGSSVPLAATVPCGVCPPEVDPGCLSGFNKGMLLLKDTPAGKEKLLIKMLGGPSLVQTDLGDPTTMGGTAYTACIYAGTTALVGHLTLDRAGATCGASPCWTATGGAPPDGKGYTYRDSTLSAGGIFKLLYKSGGSGRSKAMIKGRGAGLPHNIAAALQSSPSATVQLRGSDAPQCLSLTLSSITKHDPDFFKAK